MQIGKNVLDVQNSIASDLNLNQKLQKTKRLGGIRTGIYICESTTALRWFRTARIVQNTIGLISCKLAINTRNSPCDIFHNYTLHHLRTVAQLKLSCPRIVGADP